MGEHSEKKKMLMDVLAPSRQVANVRTSANLLLILLIFVVVFVRDFFLYFLLF